MNMISTGAFLPETDASTKQNELVKKLTAAWEKKNSKAARAGGASLMALSLAACGGEDDTPFSAADVSAAEAAATTAALTGADGTVYASVDAAVTSNDTAIADAARAEGVASVDITTDNQAAIDAAVAAVDLTTDNAAAIDAAVAADTAFASLSDLVAAYDALANPTAASAALTTSTDILTGTSSSDSFTGGTATYASTDVISDASTTDNDTFTFTATDDDDLDGSIVNIENVNINVSAFTTTTGTVYTGSIAGVSAGTNVTLDVTQAGSSIIGATLTGVDSVTVTTSSDFQDLTLTGDANADIVVVSNYVGTDEFDLVIAAAASQMDTLTVTSADDLHIVDTAGSEVAETITATSAGDIEISATAGPETVNLTAANEVVMTDIDNAETLTLSANGTGFTATGAATTATAESSIATAATLDTVNISGNGGAVRLDVTAGQASINTVNMSGEHDVTLDISAADHQTLATKLTVNDTTTAGTTKVTFNAASTANIDVRAIGADQIELDADFAGETITTAAQGQNFIASNDQGTGLIFTSALATAATNSITFEVSDVVTTTTGTTATTYDIDDITFTNYATVNLVATDNFANQTTGGLVANLDAGSAVVNVSGSGTFSNITAGQITASEINASELTGAATLFLDGDVITKVTTGSGADTLTLDDDAASGFTLATGAGNDTIAMGTTDTSVTVDGGDGTDTVTMTGSIDLSGQTFSLTNVEILDLDLSGAGASTLTVNSEQLTGKSLTVLTTTGTDDILQITVNGAVADMSGLNIEAGAITTNIDATTHTGTAATTVTGTNDADDIDIDGGVGSVAYGMGGADNIAGGAGADTIDGGAGGDTITGGGGADTITGGEGADTITSGNGADTIDLTETTAATDTIITTATMTTSDTITGFAAGSASTADEVDISITSVEALATNISDIDNAANDATATDATASTVTEAFDAANLTSGTDLLIVGGGLTFSSAGALADALEDGGSIEMTVNGTDTAGDIYMVLYSDGTNSHLAAVETSIAAGDNGTYAAGELTANLILSFNGISDATDFAATNFDFI